MAEFKAFKPSALKKIASAMGYEGDMSAFQDYVESDPQRQQQMQRYQQKAQMMAKGGVVKMNTGGTAGTVTTQPQTTQTNVPATPTTTGTSTPASTTNIPAVPTNTQSTVPTVNYGPSSDVLDVTATKVQTPALPTGSIVQAAMTPQESGGYVDQTTGQLTGSVAIPTAQATTSFAQAPTQLTANLAGVEKSESAVNTAIQANQAAQGTVDPKSEIVAAQQTASSVGNVSAAQGNASLINNAVQRNIQQGELISGAAADAQTAAKFAEQIDAAQATPSKQATVAGQLEQLTANFDAKNPPAWAAGALRAATSALASRGLGASSIAGQAVVQATLESALPIAQADAATQAQFESQNLSNRQQRAILAAQQRAAFIGQEFDQEFQTRVANAAKISDIANMNFTAEQQVQLENSRATNTMNLQNLSNKQAMVLAEASALANLDQANLNNRQQAAVQNAQSFLQMDMQNLSNEQQMAMFNSQSRIQSLFTDQAAQNAANQFNASSQNQVDQFFANLANNVSQFNATQSNAQSQFNAGQRNVLERFNAELNNQRDQFNANNQLAIAQNNTVWRRQIATADTAAINRANELNAQAILGISENAYNNLWQLYADTMEFAWESGENEADRNASIAVAKLNADSDRKLAEIKADAQSSAGWGSAVGSILSASGSSVIGNVLGNIF